MVFFSVLLLGSLLSGQAQGVKPKVKSWPKILPEQQLPKIDTVMIQKWDSTAPQFKSGPIEIPNAYKKSKHSGIVYNMPIVKLYGKGLAPMPGTEKLDELDKKNSATPQIEVLKSAPVTPKDDRKLWR